MRFSKVNSKFSPQYKGKRRKSLKQKKLFELVKNKIIIYIVLTSIILGGLVYLFVCSDVFKIREFEVSGARENINNSVLSIAKDYSVEKVAKLIGRDNFWFFSFNQLKGKLFDKYPVLENVKVGHSGLHKVTIELQEKSPVALYCQVIKNLGNISRCFFLDKKGIAYLSAPEIEGGKLPILKRNSDGEIKIGSSVIDPTIFQKVNDVLNTLEANLPEVEAKEFILTNNLELELRTNEAWVVYFDITRDLKQQVLNLKQLLIEQIKDKRASISYIDLRIEGRVYYK
ncbi:MAG: hypothetical protein COU81_02210 [Candidatus Portnoybacteria bacterium CG10_big_fil_rev_8_21_14_0_10_36_7]|uniref:POTRA domain-containing protein n=1 Tax=Candidatus Portnoybacteria bacterium CG10_big_fil_rev_8_21_14_0_10_36_7 TaxID=1974812 RepID=A0A2M8KE26_9BACT|nr:MAG: hypothetical protein COU81_02210 [Candidatus Portnoybacteria bacterium CG10_big_fil_rev_8_21_14_0_10_36_7]